MARLAPLRAPRVAYAASAAALLCALIAVAALLERPAAAQRQQTTTLISRAADGGTPNGPSTNAVISGDRRYARVIAFQSDATDIVSGDSNQATDVFAIKRAGSFGNNGSTWRPGKAILLSKGLGGEPANGRSFSPAVDGAFDHLAGCVAFLSAASNLVGGDTNDKVDAFLSRGPGDSLSRVSTPGGSQATEDTTAVAVSGDCTKVAFVTGGRLYVRTGSSVKRIDAKGDESDPSFATGMTNDLVFGANGGIYMSAGGSRSPKRIVKSGRNPAYNSIKRRVVAYEKGKGGHVQVAFRDLGRKQRFASRSGRKIGNGDSRDPVIGNSGFYIAFETDASNLGTNAAGQRLDRNRHRDSYLYSDARGITLVQSVEEKGVPLPAGGTNPSLSFYANYILFESAAPLGRRSGVPQVFMRYLGPV
ncbi:MAG TPA: hypothetical protein VF520_07930 [Thermoleophilaceae bacterium]|jgi:hypothetical protein